MTLRQVVAQRRGSAIGAALGLTAALIASLRVSLPVAPDQLTGFALARGWNPNSDVLRLLLVFALPIAGGVIGRGIASRHRGESLPLRPRPPLRQPAARRRRLWPALIVAHGLTLWSLLAAPLGRHGLPPLATLAGLLVVSGALAIRLGNRDPERGALFLAAACPILPLAFGIGSRPPSAFVGAALGFLLPILAWRVGRRRAPILAGLRAAAVVLLLPGSVSAVGAALDFRVPTVANLFEDGHGLLPASEFLRGKRPYRDVVPGHGLVIDGLSQAAALRGFGDDYRGFRRGEKVSGALFWPAIYLLAWAATGSPAFAFFGAVFSFLFFPQYAFTRATMSITTLAAATYAARSGNRRAWTLCGVALPIGFCVAVEFATYALVGSAVAWIVGRGGRKKNLRSLALGAVLSAAPIAIALWTLGLLGLFLWTTFVFVPSLLPAYALGLPMPSSLRAIPGDLALLAAFLTMAVLILGTSLPFAPVVGRRLRGSLPILAWIVAAAMSVVERGHVNYPLLLVPLALLIVVRGATERSPSGAALVGAVAIAVIAAPHAAAFAQSLGGRISDPLVVASDVRTLPEFPRARGALFRPDAAALIAGMDRASRDMRFQPADTWLDFANAPGLYYVLDRPCPIRYYEVPFYESRAAQAEVVNALERDPRIRAVLLHSGLPSDTIDGIPNAARAPLVAQAIERLFEPFSRDGPIEIWIRKAPAEGSGL